MSEALARITPDQLKQKYDWKLINNSEIYPQGWREGDEDYILGNFASLKKLYESAAHRHIGIIQWLN